MEAHCIGARPWHMALWKSVDVFSAQAPKTPLITCGTPKPSDINQIISFSEKLNVTKCARWIEKQYIMWVLHWLPFLPAKFRMVTTAFQGHGESPVSLRARYSWPPAADTTNWVSHGYIMELSAFRSMKFRSKKSSHLVWEKSRTCLLEGNRVASSPQKPHFPCGTNNGTINWVDSHEPSVQFWRGIIRFNGIYALTSQLWRTCSEFSESTWISVWLWKFPRISILLEQC